MNQVGHFDHPLVKSLDECPFLLVGGPYQIAQSINLYSVFLNLSAAVDARLADPHSELETTRQSVALRLRELQKRLLSREPLVDKRNSPATS